MKTTVPAENPLGTFLRDRRTQLDPASFGFAGGRRRTPGLRREEVALRANISPTWYTWLEQGRGGAPSADVLDRIARGLMLTEAERQHLHILTFGHPPESHYRADAAITTRLQAVLDSIPYSPAMIISATWDVLAWNRAAALLMTDFAQLPEERRNVLRLIFTNSEVRARQPEWRDLARALVGSFRADVARAGATAEVTQLVTELSQASAEFAALWQANEVGGHEDGVKRLQHARLGLIELDFATFSVRSRPDLTMMVYTPASPEVATRVRAYIDAAPEPSAQDHSRSDSDPLALERNEAGT
ncbi:XRE family transcriptional regulator [Thioclava dalianensis]|uniref:XRE family transcriptional regulator n=1 Tax=Thioclava dalianensis TaxID=1185766 RepID=A0A074TM64_9RHOB|nr:helix-turn-helix transcriptional regulator [Thioclava dalianensis]KEP70093.1 XRE family transcriptional regulator [Thioclava dalianensis]SFN51334.1 Helix-turn-helix domain-containing protein [Thioclava dalianensis]